MSWLINKINNYLFKPGFVRDLSTVRIVVVGVQLYFLIISIFGIYASNGANLDVQKWLVSIDSNEFKPILALKIFLAPFGWGSRPTIMFLHAVWLVAIVTGFTSLIGFYKRLSLLVFVSANTILIAHSYSYTEQHHTEALIILFLWVLVFGENIRTWSIDNLRRKIIITTSRMQFFPRNKNETDIYSRWPLILMQALFAAIYLSAGIEKIKGGFNSYSLMYSFVIDGITKGHSLGIFLSGFPFLLKIMAPISLAFETTFFIIMFFPGLTWIYVLFGSIFHLSIYIIQGPPFIHYIALYVVFIEPLRNTYKKKFGKVIKYKLRWNLIYDGLCPLCIRTVTIIDYFDLRGKLNFIDFENEKQEVKQLNNELKDDDLRHSMHLISPNGKIYKGFFAFEKLASLMPVLWITVPFLKIPFVSNAGNYLYHKIAGNRKRHICNAEYCAIAANNYEKKF